MDKRVPGSGESIVSRGFLFSICLLMLIMSVDVMAQTRRFQMALFYSSDPGYTDLSWINPGDAQPAAPRRSILQIDGVYQYSNLASYLSGLGYDWSRIAAVVIDEPYWGATGGPSTGDWSNPCWDSRQGTIDSMKTILSNAAEAVKDVSASISVSTRTRFWINFSEPEIQWMMDETCPQGLDLPYIDVISLDKYNVPFADVKPYYDWLVANRPKQNQQFALVPGTFYWPGNTDPYAAASWLQGYFDYANAMNNVGWNEPIVWLVAGWPGLSYAVDVGSGIYWNPIFYPDAWPIAQYWQNEAQKQRLDNMAGYMEVIDEYNGIIYGWAVDRTQEKPPYVDFWVDGQYWGGTVANADRPDVEAVFGISKAGYTFYIPQEFKDGGCHWVDAYVVAPSAETWNHRLLDTVYGHYFCYP